MIWKNAGELVGGLASDFAAMATSASQEANHFKIEFPASAGSATAFLNRNEITKQFQNALENLTGQSCRYSVVLQEPESAATPSGLPISGRDAQQTLKEPAQQNGYIFLRASQRGGSEPTCESCPHNF